MHSADDLLALLRRIDGRGYPAYKDLAPAYQFDGFILRVDHVQGDPFAAPSRLAVRLPLGRARFAPRDLDQPARSTALADFLSRRFAAACRRASSPAGSGKSGVLAMDEPGQEVLQRTSVLFAHDAIEARFVAGLPARGRKVLGKAAWHMLGELLPKLVDACLLESTLDDADRPALARHLDAVEDARALRDQLDAAGLVAFVADGAILPRRSGVDDGPLDPGQKPVSFVSPPTLRVELTAPHAGGLTGMGIPRGVTLIVGGGYHGKSTLLAALQRGVYDHKAGDGRERVVTVPGAVKIRAEDGRRVEAVDISPFIRALPRGRDTHRFRSDDASGSTSQAANIVEAIEAGASLLLLDEDSSATNFIIRDARMQALIAREHEPITPFLDRVRSLYDEHGVSTVLVMGGSGDYFDVADTVIALESFVPWDATERALQIAAEQPVARNPDPLSEGRRPLAGLPRRPQPGSLDPSRGRRDVHLRARGTRTLLFGTDEIDLSAVEQLVDDGQVRAIAEALAWFAASSPAPSAKGPPAKDLTLPELLDAVDRAVAERGLDAFTRRPAGDLVAFRRFEFAAALNRLRSLRVGE